MYAVRIKVDEKLPWIELERTYTYKEARRDAEDFLNNMQMKIVTVPQKTKQEELRARRKQGVRTRKNMQQEVLSPTFSVDQSYVCLSAREH